MLAAIQSDFYKIIFQKNYSKLALFSSDHPTERLAIYKTSIIQNMRNSLEINYPGVWPLLGQDCADNLAYAFCSQQSNFPNTGCLDNWGEKFPDFLSKQPELKSLPYLKDFASYEWLKHCAYCANSATSLNASDLQISLDRDQENICFSLLPSLFLFTAHFAIDQIQMLVENKNATAIDLQATKVYGVIVRPAEEVLVFWIDRDLYYFLQALKLNKSLKAALSKTQAKFNDFNLTSTIIFLLENKLLY